MDADQVTLADLAAAVCRQLEAEGVQPGNGQVSATVDERTLRYYVTLGLLDRPTGRRGRIAVYGARHLAQAVAVKRLQAAGWALADIQPRLAGLPTADLLAVRADEAPPLTPSPVAARQEGSQRQAFWAHPPLPEAAPPDAALPAGDAALPLTGVALPGGAVLLLPQQPAGRAPSREDARSLGAAAAPLLAEAVRRGLLASVDAVTDTNDEGEKE